MKTLLLHTKDRAVAFLLHLLVLLIFAPLPAAGQLVAEEWSRRFDGSTEVKFQSRFIAIDDPQHVYIARVMPDNYSFVVSKYSSDGTFRWANTYYSGGGSIIPKLSVRGIEADANGDLYVYGILQGSDSRDQALLLKYDAGTGQLMWEQAIRLGMFSYAEKIKFDNQGAVYLLATTDGGPERTLANVAIYKFETNTGQLIWSKLYDAGVFGSDEPEDLALDNQGGVYVLATSTGSGTGSDLLTLKYDAATGKLLWLQRLDVAAQSQYASRLVVDNAGAVYALGYHESEAGADDIEPLIVKYDADSGAQLWLNKAQTGDLQQLSIPFLPLATSDGIYVMQHETTTAGKTYLVKYSGATGAMAWATPYEGAAARTLNDGDGNVIVVGLSKGTGNLQYIKYSQASGEVIWRWQQEANIVGAIDVSEVPNQQYVSVAGIQETASGAGFIVFTFDAASGEHTTYTNNIPFKQSNDKALGLALDAEGNSYIVGNSMNDAQGSTMVVLKYSPKGDLLWRYQQAGSVLTAHALAIDTSGGVYVTGTYDSRTLFTIRVNQHDGTKAWEKFYAGDFGNTSGYAVAADNRGYVYATGVVRGRITDGMPVIKYNAESGETVWSSLLIQPIDINNTTFINYTGRAIALDAAGNVYLAGEMNERQSDYLIAKAAGTDGHFEWTKTYGNPGKIFERATALALDSTGVYVTGISEGDYATLKLNSSNGNTIWESKLEVQRPGSGTGAYALTLNGNGGLYVTGQKLAINSFSMATIKYATDSGEELWQANQDNTIGYAIETDSEGDVYVAGTGLVLVKYAAANGNKVWEQTPENASGDYSALALDAQNNIFTTGTVEETNYLKTDILTVKYTQHVKLLCDEPLSIKLYLPQVAKRVGLQVRTTAVLGKVELTEDTGVRWTWGDGSTPTISYTAFGTPRITGEHTYQEAGIYKIGLDLSESCITPSDLGYEQWMPVFDPKAGYVKGEGAIATANGLTGFNFSLGYTQPFDPVPRGHTHLLVNGVGMFRSRSLEWLVIKEHQAVWKGEGVIDGTGYYGFIVSVSDAGGAGANDAGDRLRLRIWNKGKSNRLVYDSFGEGAELLDLANQWPTIAKGNIVINGSDQAHTLNKLALQAYPNTFSERATIAFKLEQGQEYSLEIYDAKGKLVRAPAAGTAKAGATQTYELDARDLDEGLYVARLVTGKGAKSIKLLLKR